MGPYIRREPFIYGTEKALGLPALYSCARLIAESMASLPLKIYTRSPDGNAPAIRYNGPSIFDHPSTNANLYDWVYQCMTSLILHGNAWGLVTGRDGYGYPTGIDWIPPDMVQVEDDPQQPWNQLRTRVYVYGRQMTSWRDDLVHLRAFALPGRTEGISPLRAFALTVMSGLEAERYGIDWFAAGGFPPGTFQNKEIEIDAEAAAEIRESLTASIRSRQPLVYGRDWDYKPLIVPPSEAQFIECAVGETRFAMADGSLCRADQLTVGDKVISWDGTQLVPGMVSTAVPMPAGAVLRVRTQCGRELTTSVNHPYWASRRLRSAGKRYQGTLDENARWLRAEELRAGDYVRVALDWGGSEGNFDTETAWALGALAGDGHLPAAGMPSFANKDPEIIARLGTWCRDHGGDLVRSDPMRPVDYRISTGAGSRYNPSQLRRELREWGVLGRNAPDKRVPDAVMSGGRKAQAAFLSGYLDTDGAVWAPGRPQPGVVWGSVSRGLLKDCQHLLALLGIQSAIRRHQPAHVRMVAGQECQVRESWTLTACGRANVRRLAGLLTPAHPGKAVRLAHWAQAEDRGNGARSDVRWARVAAVEDAGEQVTYGVGISGTHTHVTEGLVTHNTMQMNATQLAAVYGLPPDRVGGKRGDSLTYNCLTTDSEILTLRGWLRYDQVTTDDTCLTLNTETGLAEWQPVTSVHVFEEGPYPVVKLENKSHSSVSTPNHRWPVMLSGRKAGHNGWAWKTTATLPTDARICAAAPAVTPAEPKWSDALTELVAWFWTEGWAGEYGSVTLAQSQAVNPQNVARIRNALTETFGPAGELRVRSVPSWREDHDERGLVHFRLNAKAGRVLLEHAPGKVVSTEFLSQLTRAQLELFVQTSLDADGARHGASWTMAQKDKARLDAFQVACALTGRSGVVRGPNSHGMYVMPIQLSPWRKPAGHAEYVTHETADRVWCVQTPNKSWFARRNGTCYFTGNTVEQSTLQVIEALRPWMVRLETAFFDLLPNNRYVRFNADALLKTDLKTRTEIAMQQRAMGLLTVDEIRDQEDKAPYPDAAGDEKVPLEVMVAMARSIRAVPNSMLKNITLEVDLITDRLEKLKAEGLTAPDPGSQVANPDTFLSGQIGSVRSDPGISAPAERVLGLLKSGGLDGIDMDDLLGMALERKREREQEAGPQFVGPWIPSSEDLARIAAANGNGNGRHNLADVARGAWSGPSYTDPPFEYFQEVKRRAKEKFGVELRDPNAKVLSLQQYRDLVEDLQVNPPVVASMNGRGH